MKPHTTTSSGGSCTRPIDRIEEMLKSIRMNSSLLYEIKSSTSAEQTLNASERKRLVQVLKQLMQQQQSCHTKILRLLIALQFATLSVLTVSSFMGRV
jgi:DNA-binding transcriptional regulator YbjK